MAALPTALPHGPLQVIFPDIYSVTGQINVGPDGVLAGSRNMTVVRDNGSLTLVNTLRLEAIDATGIRADRRFAVLGS